MTAAILVTVLFIPFVFIVLLGYGDNLIAGYNTASKEEKGKYDTKRLRWVISGTMFLVVLIYWLPVMIAVESILVQVLLFPILFISLILANTWAKKR